MDQFALNSPLTIDVKPVGTSGEKMLIIDDVCRDPDAVVAAAAATRQWKEMAAGGYPGRRAPLPGGYARAVLRRMDQPIRQRLFPEETCAIDRFECSYSMVTRPAAALTPMQRIPHIDTVSPNRIAILHYLCDAEFGGTAFFQQRRTGMEKVTPGARDRYRAARDLDLAELAAGNGYPDTATPGYARTDFVTARFNRMIIYRSCLLHSGMITAADALTDDPRSGRLTATFFVDYGAGHSTGNA